MVIEQTSPGAAGQAWAEEPMRDRAASARILLDTDPNSLRVRSVLKCVSAGTKYHRTIWLECDQNCVTRTAPTQTNGR